MDVHKKRGVIINFNIQLYVFFNTVENNVSTYIDL